LVPEKAFLGVPYSLYAGHRLPPVVQAPSYPLGGIGLHSRLAPVLPFTVFHLPSSFSYTRVGPNEIRGYVTLWMYLYLMQCLRVSFDSGPGAPFRGCPVRLSRQPSLPSLSPCRAAACLPLGNTGPSVGPNEIRSYATPYKV
jgi:hypothetical protein